MELQLKNIGMIKEANVKIDGLTVIAGENDTGKSTVGKALFFEVREYIFKRSSKALYFNKDEKIKFPIFIDTPNLLVIFEYIRNTSILVQQNELNFDLPIETTDLILRLSQSKLDTQQISSILIKEVIHGEVIYDKYKDAIFFKKDNLKEKLEMDQTSNGIKMFGFFQILLNNGSIKEGTVLILDEPEVHLHPKWQLEMAKIIIELVNNGVKVLVNSHSPYMIEALERYAEKAEVTADFYLAEDGYIKKENDSNSETLAKIFEKLSEPFDVFEEMDSQSMEKLING